MYNRKLDTRKLGISITGYAYLNTFTAMDQLSINKFDVEHIAPKEQMKKLIASTEGAGLPISCVTSRNMLIGARRIKISIRIKSICRKLTWKKYSFTTSDDLEWMDMPYEGAKDFDELRQFYTDFLTERFTVMKKYFCESMDIDYDAMSAVTEEPSYVPETKKVTVSPRKSTNMFINECIERVENNINGSLERIRRSVFTSSDGSKGYVFCASKAYRQGDREKYWFGYRRGPVEDIAGCEEKYIVYGCKDAKEVLVIPVDDIEKVTSALNYSIDEDGEISHWHIVFFRDETGHMTQLLSKPELKEIDIDEYKIEEA